MKEDTLENIIRVGVTAFMVGVLILFVGTLVRKMHRELYPTYSYVPIEVESVEYQNASGIGSSSKTIIRCKGGEVRVFVGAHNVPCADCSITIRYKNGRFDRFIKRDQ